MSFKNYYEILGVESEASLEQIRDGYRNVSSKYKSTTNQIDEFKDEMLKSINEAIEVLSNPEKRSEYDKTLFILDAALVNTAPTQTIKTSNKPAAINVERDDAERIGELIKKHFEKEKVLREKYESLLATQGRKSQTYFTSVKVIMCAVIVGVAFYFHSPHRFQFDFADEKKENFTYEYYTKDTTMIYDKPELKRAKVLKGVGKGTGFNVISETTYCFKIAYINTDGRNQEGYIKKEELEKSVEIPF